MPTGYYLENGNKPKKRPVRKEREIAKETKNKVGTLRKVPYCCSYLLNYRHLVCSLILYPVMDVGILNHKTKLQSVAPRVRQLRVLRRLRLPSTLFYPVWNGIRSIQQNPGTLRTVLIISLPTLLLVILL